MSMAYIEFIDSYEKLQNNLYALNKNNSNYDYLISLGMIAKFLKDFQHTKFVSEKEYVEWEQYLKTIKEECLINTITVEI